MIDASGNDPRPTDEEMGVLANQLQLGQDLYDVNQSYNDSGRPMFGMADLFAPGGALSFAAPSFSPSSAPNMMQNAMQGILGATQMQGPMGSTFGIRPVARDGNLGVMANFTVPFEDGGPVGMQRGGVTFESGRSYEAGRGIGEQNREMDLMEAAAQGGVDYSNEGIEQAMREAETEQSVNDAIAAVQQMEEAGQRVDAQFPVDLTAGVDIPESSLPQMDAVTADRVNRRSGEINMALRELADRTGTLDEVMPIQAPVISYTDLDLLSSDLLQGDVVQAPGLAEFILGPRSRDMKLAGERGQLDEQIAVSAPDPLTDSFRGMGQAGDFDFGPAAPRAQDLIMNTLATPVEYKTRGGKEVSTTLEQDLMTRQQPSNLPGFLGKVADAFGTSRTGDILANIGSGAPAVIDASSGQAMGYVGSGPMGFGQTYTGRGGFDPFAQGADVRFDPSRNAYFVDYTPPGGSNSDESTPFVVPPVADTTDTAPPLVVTPPTTGLPPAMPDPMDVLVPSARRDVTAVLPPVIAPQGSVDSTFLPQSFLDLLASFNRPAPVAMQDGGAVLDKAADDFLGALRSVA